ncbi:MAG: hypothetical protein WC346_17250 [Methanogenium sp.]|jgi:TATA-box binding protein (TBP) (component of TFIID and TFIIIB)
MVKEKKIQKNYGAILELNLGKDKKSNKIIRLSKAIATTAKSKEDAKKTFKNELDRFKKRKGVTKVFGINPILIKDKKKFVKYN